jgi:hypothetical protein
VFTCVLPWLRGLLLIIQSPFCGNPRNLREKQKSRSEMLRLDKIIYDLCLSVSICGKKPTPKNYFAMILIAYPPPGAQY